MERFSSLEPGVWPRQIEDLDAPVFGKKVSSGSRSRCTMSPCPLPLGPAQSAARNLAVPRDRGRTFLQAQAQVLALQQFGNDEDETGALEKLDVEDWRDVVLFSVAAAGLLVRNGVGDRDCRRGGPNQLQRDIPPKALRRVREKLRPSRLHQFVRGPVVPRRVTKT